MGNIADGSVAAVQEYFDKWVVHLLSTPKIEQEGVAKAVAVQSANTWAVGLGNAGFGVAGLGSGDGGRDVRE